MAGTNLAFLVTNAISQLLIIPGKRALRWNGVECWQGTAPLFLHGQAMLHILDVRKTLAPLVAGSDGLILSNRVVVIDPGHGGVNAGAKNIVDPRSEKEFTLDWALRLRPLLQKEGWEVHLTRTNDVDLSLTNRVAFADQKGAALFLSLHFNSNGPQGSPSGLETFCVTPAGMVSSLLRGEEEVGQVNPNNAWDASNLALAMRVHRSLLRRAALPDRGVRRARFMGVIRLQDRPAILVEAGYLSHPGEARLIATPEFRQRLAEGVAQALKLQ